MATEMRSFRRESDPKLDTQEKESVSGTTALENPYRTTHTGDGLFHRRTISHEMDPVDNPWVPLIDVADCSSTPTLHPQLEPSDAISPFDDSFATPVVHPTNRSQPLTPIQPLSRAVSPALSTLSSPQSHLSSVRSMSEDGSQFDEIDFLTAVAPELPGPSPLSVPNLSSHSYAPSNRSHTLSDDTTSLISSPTLSSVPDGSTDDGFVNLPGLESRPTGRIGASALSEDDWSDLDAGSARGSN